MIKAIIFDCFGVLVEGSLEPFYYRYFNSDYHLIEQAKVLDNRANIGSITYKEFVEQMASLAGIPIQEARDFLDNNPPNLGLLDFIKNDLKSRYKVGFLSNAAENWLDELFSPDQIKLFDDIVLSCDVGLVKPDPKIFELAATRLGIKTDECIFVDDLERYCDGARAAGMQAFLYNDFVTLKNDLGLISAIP